jgi:hypothetical protein
MTRGFQLNHFVVLKGQKSVFKIIKFYDVTSRGKTSHRARLQNLKSGSEIAKPLKDIERLAMPVEVETKQRGGQEA